MLGNTLLALTKPLEIIVFSVPKHRTVCWEAEVMQLVKTISSFLEI